MTDQPPYGQNQPPSSPPYGGQPQGQPYGGQQYGGQQYGGQNYGNGTYAAPAGNGMAVASLVLGILSLLFVWIPIIGMVSWIFAPLGLIFGFIGMNRQTGRGMAIAGLVCSILGLLGCIAWLVLFGAAAVSGAGDAATATTAAALIPSRAIAA